MLGGREPSKAPPAVDFKMLVPLQKNQKSLVWLPGLSRGGSLESHCLGRPSAVGRWPWEKTLKQVTWSGTTNFQSLPNSLSYPASAMIDLLRIRLYNLLHFIGRNIYLFVPSASSYFTTYFSSHYCCVDSGTFGKGFVEIFFKSLFE